LGQRTDPRGGPKGATKDEKKMKEKNLMDEDYLPSILSGDRGRHGGRVKIGAGKNANSKKR
jgi:RNA-binding protein NOB1